ncbi:MAG: heme-binding domain-containing protein [bacterium]|jgi:hypothetical protein
MLKKIAIGLLIVFLAIQFFRPAKNTSTTTSANHISTHYNTPDDVKALLERSCYDCHSNNTKYPWYASIQPVAWWLGHHIEEGKGEINFDEFMALKPKKAHHKMDEVNEMVQEGEMPLDSYTWIHRNAKLSRDEKTKLSEWALSVMKTIEQEHGAELKDEASK